MKKILLLSLTLFMGFFVSANNPDTRAQIKPLIGKYLVQQKVVGSNNANTFNITSLVEDSRTELIHVYFNQTVNNKEIYGAVGNITFKYNNNVPEVVNFHHSFYPNPENKITQLKSQPLSRVFQDLAASLSQNVSVEFVYSKNSKSYTANNPLDPEHPIKAKEMYAFSGGVMVPSFAIEWHLPQTSHWFNFIINGVTSEIVYTEDWYAHCKFDGVSSGHKHQMMPPKKEQTNATEVNGASYRVFPLRVESPNHGSRVLSVDPEDLDASPYGWHDINGVNGNEFTVTRGNNVYAREDLNADNSGGYSVDGGSSLAFDANYSGTNTPSQNLDAAIINLFYWNNLMHDVWHHYGFDEASGNFQQNNYSNQGSGGDYVNADAQDGSGVNNANFATPPEGNNPRMQMFIWQNNTTQNLMQQNSPNYSKYGAQQAGFGPDLSATPITGDLILVQGTSGDPSLGCGSLNNTNALNGNIALIRRGDCQFVQKVLLAQSAGAKAAVIMNNTGGIITMGDNGDGNQVTIPSIMISQSDGNNLENLVGSNTVYVSLYDSAGINSLTFDSDFDNGIIAHEYGHGISTRLTGGPSNSGCLSNQEQMGEGWSDFFALVMTHEIGDKGTDKRGIGTYVRNQSVNGNGIRPYPYSTSFAINPVTYNDVKSSIFTVPHGVGSIWCTMLWDMYWAFIDEYGFDDDIYKGTGGNNIAMELVIEGMKLQPCNPGFVDGRNGILQADKNLNQGKNQRIIWEAFAKRGLGYDADQGSSNSRSDGSEDFDIPPFLDQQLFVKKRVAKTVAEGKETIKYTLFYANYGSQPLNGVTLTDTLPTGGSFDQFERQGNAIISDNVIKAQFATISPNHIDSIVFTYTLPNGVTTEIWHDDLEGETTRFTTETLFGNEEWELISNNALSGDNTWFIADEAVQSDHSLQLNVGVFESNLGLWFYHNYTTEEGWDGAVIEYKVEGEDWKDAADMIVLNGYNGTIAENPASSISGRSAFTGNSNGYVPCVLSFNGFVGKTVSIRFRFASDAAQGGLGWFIDDFSFVKLKDVKNTFSATGQTPVFFVSDDVHTLLEIGEEDNIGTGNKLQETNCVIYPNPTSNILNIETTEPGTFEVFDAAGRLLKTGEVNKQKQINVSQWNAGVYYVKFTSTTNQYTQSFVKQ